MSEEQEILRAPDAKLVRELSLVLKATGIPHRVESDAQEERILTPSEHASAALEQLAQYHRENLRRGVREEPLPTRAGWQAEALIWGLLLCGFHVLTEAGAFGMDWRQVGAVDGRLMREGQVWRPITALFLHADLQHIAGNLAFGALFVVLLYQVLGSAWSWTLILFGAALGNSLNALVSGPGLRSLGASTAVFATLGSLTAISWSRKRATARNRFKRWVPLLAGILLLAWNGMGGAHYDPWSGLQRPTGRHTDIGAHLAGFACGGFLGVMLWQLQKRELLSERAEHIARWLTPSVALLAWIAALWFGSAPHK